mgnify:FL=1
MWFPAEQEVQKPGLNAESLSFKAFKQWVSAEIGEQCSERLTDPDSHLKGLPIAFLGLELETRRAENLIEVLRLVGLGLDQIKPTMNLELGWISLFVLGAKEASQPIEREVWSGLLIAEMSEPGSVNKRTLNFLSSMEPWELEAFVAYAAFAFRFESGWKFIFDEDFAWRELWSYGREVDLTRHWVDLGLVVGSPSELDASSARFLRIGYGDQHWEISPPLPVSAERLPRIKYLKFSALGQQIASAAKAKTYKLYARNLIKHLREQVNLQLTEVES